MTITARADFNNVSAQGLLKVSTLAVDGHVTINAVALITDALEDQHVVGSVESVVDGVVYFRVDWRQLDQGTNLLRAGTGLVHVNRPAEFEVSDLQTVSVPA